MVARPGQGQSGDPGRARLRFREPHHRPGRPRPISTSAAGPLFLHGQAVVRRFTLVGVQLTLVRTMSGGLRLGVEKDKNQHDILSRIADAVSLRSDKKSSLQAFAVRNARLAFYDEPDPSCSWWRRTRTSTSPPPAPTSRPRRRRCRDLRQARAVTGEFTIPSTAAPVKGSVAVSGLDLRALGRNSRTFTGVKDIGLVVGVSASFAKQGAHILSADFGMDAKGSLAVPGLIHRAAQGALAGFRGTLRRRVQPRPDRRRNARRRGATRISSPQADLVHDGEGALSRVAFQTTIDKIALKHARGARGAGGAAPGRGARRLCAGDAATSCSSIWRSRAARLPPGVGAGHAGPRQDARDRAERPDGRARRARHGCTTGR